MSDPRPPRLTDDPELGSALRELAESTKPSASDLARNAEAIAKRLDAPAPPTMLGPAGKLLLLTMGLMIGTLMLSSQLRKREETETVATPTPVAVASPASTAVAIAPAVTPLVTPPKSIAAPPSTPDGTLAAQIALYDRARAAEKRGDFPAALAALADLDSKFPAGALAPEAALLRAALLVRAGHIADAIAAYEALARDSRHLGRHGEIFRTLGDLRAKSGDCPRALAAYEKARSLPLAESDADAVRRGIVVCE